jgi:hypothetical protein
MAKDRTPTPRARSTQSSPKSAYTAIASLPSSGSTFGVYIVTNIRYPTSQDFDQNKGSFRIDSVHTSAKNANARAKKLIYDGGEIDGGQFKHDIDKVIEQMENGMFAGIGIGGKGDGRESGCYARKCQVEYKMIDEDSEDESEYEERMGENEKEGGGNVGDYDGDVRMG